MRSQAAASRAPNHVQDRILEMRETTAPPRLRGRLLLALLIAFVVVFSFRTSIGRAMGRALIAEDPLETADVIVVPEWTLSAGALEAADLVHRGIAPSVLVLVKPEEPSTRELVRRGILSAHQSMWLVGLLGQLGVQTVDQIEGSDGGTRAEASALAAWCLQRRVGTIIVITTLDHSRRVSRVLRRSMRGGDTKVIVRSTRYARFDPERWWETRDSVRTEIVELQKLLVDFVSHPLS